MRNYWKSMVAAVAGAVIQVPLPPDAPMWLRVTSAGAFVGLATLAAPKNKPSA